MYSHYMYSMFEQKLVYCFFKLHVCVILSPTVVPGLCKRSNCIWKCKMQLLLCQVLVKVLTVCEIVELLVVLHIILAFICNFDYESKL